ncbi:MAG: tetratricopeptide repeat protein [Burkholderiales bacterium]|nr:tetratricopeptide repeat protein [Burkholderiales bacterium]
MLRTLYRHWRRAGAAVDPGAELARLGDLVRAGDAGAADRAIADFLARHPGSAQGLHLQGLNALSAGRPAEAATALEQAAARAPGSPMIRANLALALWRVGEVDRARGLLEGVLAEVPGLASAALNLANLRLEAGDAVAASRQLAGALEHAGDMEDHEAAQLWVALAGLEPLLPHIDGRQCLRRAAALDPGSPTIPLLGYMSHASRCDWSFPAQRLAEFFEQGAVAEPPANAPVLAPAIADCLPLSAPARLAAARRYGRMVEGRVAALPRPVRRSARAGDGPRIRLGYLSADFHQHPTMQLLRGVLACHDRTRFELHAYSYGPDDGSAMRREAVAAFEHFVDVTAEAPARTAARIAADAIDILVDLKGYTGAARPEIAALRPAPVQVSYLGYPGTTGAGFIDYLVADPVLVPAGAEPYYSERIVRLPHTYQPTDNAQPVDAQPVTRADAGLPADAFVFCSFNSPYKIEPEIFGVWMEILRACPHAVLWVLADQDEARGNLRREAQARGVAPERLVFAASLPKARHLARMRLADLFLDTHRVNAHTTASDAIWVGLPLITAPGSGFASRVAASVLAAAGLDDMICADLAAYRDRAVALAGDAQAMADLRRRCAAARRAGALFDTPSYTRALEAAYITMYEIHAAGAPPADFCVRRDAAPRSC